MAHLVESLLAHLAGCLCATAQDIVHACYVALILLAALAHRLKTVVEDIQEELLACAVAETATHVVGFHLVEIGIVRQELLEVIVCAESVEIDEDRVLVLMLHSGIVCVCATEVSGVLDIEMERVGEHAVDLLLQLFWRIGEIDAVAERLGHLGLAVSAREAQACRVVRKKNLRLYECLTIYVVETAHNLVRLLEHRLLVLAHRDCRRLEESYVGSL